LRAHPPSETIASSPQQSEEEAVTVAIEMRFAGATLAQYDQVMELMNLGDTPPEGAIFHWVAGTGDGIVVLDVWETMEQFDRFARENIGPFTQQVGIPSPPEITTYAVHNTLPG
jgi:hypothetical protein